MAEEKKDNQEPIRGSHLSSLKGRVKKTTSAMSHGDVAGGKKIVAKKGGKGLDVSGGGNMGVGGAVRFKGKVKTKNGGSGFSVGEGRTGKLGSASSAIAGIVGGKEVYLGGSQGEGGVTKLFTNQVLGRIEKMRMVTSRRFTNRMQGEHLSGKGGTSTEFSDYRDYVEGDDIRYVDWNIFSRLGRPYLKQFHHEEEMHLVLVVDGSNSMMFEGKLQRAKQLAGAFGVMGLFGNEKVSCYSIGCEDGREKHLVPCTGRGSLLKLFKYLEGLKGGGDEQIEEGVERILHTHRGRGVVVIVSDWLSYGDVSGPLTRLTSNGLEVYGVQVLSPMEIDPVLEGDLRFVDSEGAGMLEVSAAGDVVGLYQEYRMRYERHLENHCRQRGGKFVVTGSQDELDYVLFDLLMRKGWVR